MPCRGSDTTVGFFGPRKSLFASRKPRITHAIGSRAKNRFQNLRVRVYNLDLLLDLHEMSYTFDAKPFAFPLVQTVPDLESVKIDTPLEVSTRTN